MAQLARDFPGQPLVVEMVLKGQWRTLMGERISGHCVPLSFQDGTLKVAASDEHWLAELSGLSEDIRKRLNRALGREIVRSVHFVSKN